MAELSFIDKIQAVRKKSCPLVIVQTADPAASMRAIGGTINGTPVIRWDISRGMEGLNDPGVATLKKLLGEKNPASFSNPSEVLKLASGFPKETILFFLNIHRYVDSTTINGAAVSQAIWNLRDEYKKNFRTLIMFCPSITLPQELKGGDVIIIDEPLPKDDELKEIILRLHKSAEIDAPEPKILSKAIDATKGLSAFSAEQMNAVSLTKEGLDLDTLWEGKRKQVEQTPGLQMWRGKETFADVRGAEFLKKFLTGIFTGAEPPTVLLFMDEIEKMLAGAAGGDLSGVSQEMHGEFLSWMVDNDVDGLLEVGHAGCGKSHITKAAGNQFLTPTVVFNLSALKATLMGQSGAQLRAALKVIMAIGRPFIMATSNNLSVLSPELKSRFTTGTFFFDLPTKDERDAMWELYIKKYKIGKEQLADVVDDDDWTGREIKSCCKLAWKLKYTLKEASGFIVPLCLSAPDKIEELRSMAEGKFLNAAAPGGIYRRKVVSIEEGVRKVRMD